MDNVNLKQISLMNNQISNYQTKIISLNSDITDLNNKLTNLNDIKSELNKKQEKFLEVVDYEANDLRNANQIENLKLANDYSQEMNTLLNGNKYQAAITNFEDILTNIQYKINEIEENIALKQTQIYNIETQIKCLQASIIS